MGLRSFSRIISLWICLTGLSYGQSWQPLSSIELDAKNYLEQQLSNRYPSQKISVSINAIDPRLKLTLCDKALTYHLHEKSLRASNVTLKSQCRGEKPWSFYLTAKVTRKGKVVVANRDLARFETLNESDVRVDYRAISSANGNTLSSTRSVVGLQTKKAIRAGDLISSSHLTPPQVVIKGDQVTVTAFSQGISVATAGTAMSNGKVGEQIRVQNNNTDRIIKARVTGAGQVQVVL
ncbi:MAG: flagellar basal body P-ring formation chaperone FlgA [Cellvibrionaceae bacterium]